MSTAIIMTQVQIIGENVSLESTIILVDSRGDEDRHEEGKTITAKGWERNSYRWNEAVTREALALTAERALILRASREQRQGSPVPQGYITINA